MLSRENQPLLNSPSGTALGSAWRMSFHFFFTIALWIGKLGLRERKKLTGHTVDGCDRA